MTIKNFSFEQIQQKAKEIRKIIEQWKPKSWGLRITEEQIFLRNHAFAPLIATICDEQIKSDDAWNFPFWLNNEMKRVERNFVLEDLLKQDFRAKLKEYLEDKWPRGMDENRKRGYLDKISRLTRDALEHFDDLNCTPATLFKNRAYTALEVYFTLRRIPGIGPKKANMIARDFIYTSKGREDPNGWFTQIKRKCPVFRVIDEKSLDMPIDVHVVKVFNRLFGRRSGDWRKELPNHMLDIVAFSKLVTPEFPARLDEVFWNVGKYTCFYNPQCHGCPLNRVCDIGKRTKVN